MLNLAKIFVFSYLNTQMLISAVQTQLNFAANRVYFKSVPRGKNPAKYAFGVFQFLG